MPSGIDSRNRIKRGLGIDIGAGLWPSVPELKSYEAAGFELIQLTAPPVRMLASPRHSVSHAKALSGALRETRMGVVLRAPTSLRLGDALNDRAFEGLLEYASQIGARHVVYHPLDVPRHGRESAAEELSLRRLADWAGATEITVCLENLCALYPGASSICYDPLAVRDLVARISNPAIGMALDVGHAHVSAELMGTEVANLIEPVMSKVDLVHLHDNFGARRDPQQPSALDPLLLDLHLVPGEGTIAWERVARLLHDCAIPVIAEVDVARRVQPADLLRAVRVALGRQPATESAVAA